MGTEWKLGHGVSIEGRDGDCLAGKEGSGQHWRIMARSQGGEPRPPGKPCSLAKLDLDFSLPSLKSSQEVWGRGEPLSPVLNAWEGEEGPQQ